VHSHAHVCVCVCVCVCVGDHISACVNILLNVEVYLL